MYFHPYPKFGRLLLYLRCCEEVLGVVGGILSETRLPEVPLAPATARVTGNSGYNWAAVNKHRKNIKLDILSDLLLNFPYYFG